MPPKRTKRNTVDAVNKSQEFELPLPFFDSKINGVVIGSKSDKIEKSQPTELENMEDFFSELANDETVVLPGSPKPRRNKRAALKKKKQGAAVTKKEARHVLYVKPAEIIPVATNEQGDKSSFQTLHLVIDLDATFVSTKTDCMSYFKILNMVKKTSKLTPQAKYDIRSRMFMFNVNDMPMWSILRPGSHEFIEFASMYFKSVSVWSAGQRVYVEEIVSILFPPHLPRPSIVYSWDECEISKYEEDDDTDSGLLASPSHAFTAPPFTKPLSKIITRLGKIYGNSSHDEKETPSFKNTIIIDDRSDIAIHNPDNLIKIPPFDPTLSISSVTEKDNALGELVNFFMGAEVINTSDIRTVDKGHIFSESLY